MGLSVVQSRFRALLNVCFEGKAFWAVGKEMRPCASGRWGEGSHKITLAFVIENHAILYPGCSDQIIIMTSGCQ